MSRQILTPIGPAGAILDPDIGQTLPALAGATFGFTDVLIFSHGWYTSMETAVGQYAAFATGTAEAFIATGNRLNALEIGVHWPAVTSEDSNVIEAVTQPFSYFSRALMANAVGKHGVYSLIRLIIEARLAAGMPLPRFTLIGHSFGARVCASALQAIACEPSLETVLPAMRVNLILLQGAFDNDAFDPTQDYCSVLSAFPKLRLLVTKSSLDKALGTEYPIAERLQRLFGVVRPALGAAGPSVPTALRKQMTEIQVDSGFVPAADVGIESIIADLTRLHGHDGEPTGGIAGSHSDIFLPEIYDLIAAFVGL